MVDIWSSHVVQRLCAAGETSSTGISTWTAFNFNCMSNGAIQNRRDCWTLRIDFQHHLNSSPDALTQMFQLFMRAFHDQPGDQQQSRERWQHRHSGTVGGTLGMN